MMQPNDILDEILKGWGLEKDPDCVYELRLKKRYQDEWIWGVQIKHLPSKFVWSFPFDIDPEFVRKHLEMAITNPSHYEDWGVDNNPYFWFDLSKPDEIGERTIE